MSQREQRRHQHLQHRRDRRRRIAAHRAVAGAELDQQRDRVHLPQRAARQQRRRRCRPARPARARARPRRTAGAACRRAAAARRRRSRTTRRARRACRRRWPALRSRNARGLGHRARARARAAPCRCPRGSAARARARRAGAGRHGRPSTPAPFAGAGLASSQAASTRSAVGVHCGRARRSLEVAQPGEAVEHVLERRGELGGGREIDLGDRRLDPVDEEMPGAQRGARDRIALERAGDRRQQARPRGLAERRDQRRAGNAEAIGEADQPLAGARVEAGRNRPAPARGPAR